MKVLLTKLYRRCMSQNNRPLSPHLQIYKPQLTSMLSILHRITGAGLAAGAVVLAWWLLAALCGEESFALTQQFRGSLIGTVMLFCWLFAFIYHLLNGMRHLVWDTGRGLDLKSVYRSGWLVITCSLVLTLAVWYIAGGGFYHG